ncbi:hypothetical protein BH11BAC2_BH11BAC2_22870 [soil metagenome]
MLKSLLSFFVVAYFTFGTLCLPQGDFSALSSLTQMYQHCKATEDKDMTPLDFITDHLINIDGILDAHDNGDEQKPHTPVHYHHLVGQVVVFFHPTSTLSLVAPFVQFHFSNFIQSFYASEYNSFTFRPPITLAIS